MPVSIVTDVLLFQVLSSTNMTVGVIAARLLYLLICFAEAQAEKIQQGQRQI
jgi:hypothetical protein